MKNIRKTIGLATFAGALAVAPMALGTGTANADSGVNWDAVAACESGGNWSTPRVTAITAVCSSPWAPGVPTVARGSPHNASRAEQIRVAENVLRSQGIGAWPVCGRRG